MNNITFGDEKFGHYETVAGGAGAVSILRLSQLSSLFLWGCMNVIAFGDEWHAYCEMVSEGSVPVSILCTKTIEIMFLAVIFIRF